MQAFNPIVFFEKFNCGDYNHLFYSPSLNLYFNFQGVQDGEQCVFADARIENFAFSTVDANGSLLPVGNTLFPRMYGWPDIDECTPVTLLIRWEADEDVTSYDCTDFRPVETPKFSDNHYPV
jgi:hypothetical protein